MDEPRLATAADLDPMVEVLADAFFEDPLFGWFFPDPVTRPGLTERMFSFLGAHLFVPLGQCAAFGDAAAAFWQPPGEGVDDAFWAEHGAGFAAVLDGHMEKLGAIGVAMEEHHPTDPCWYLGMLGVRSGAQGRGLGGRLLEFTLERVDEAGEAAYLEASTPRNRSLYERNGFEVIGEISVDDSPTLWAMWRPPR